MGNKKGISFYLLLHLSYFKLNDSNCIAYKILPHLSLANKKDRVTNSMWQNSYTYIHIPSKIKETNRRSKLKMCICQ